MSYQVLARKYRPQKFFEVIGQEHVTRTLKNALAQGRTAHGYIFSGHRGIGKTTVARILAMALNCRSADRPVEEPCGVCDSCTEIRAGNSVDVLEIDAATNRGIDEIRELREGSRYRPARDRFKICILDEAHQITDAAFNALLKTLEEPPDHMVFMLATTQPEDIPQTIRSRCQHFSFRAVRFEEIVQQLKELLAREKIEADDDALALLAEAGDGSMRDALSILDQAIASSSAEKLTADSIRQLLGAIPSAAIEDVLKAVSDGSADTLLRIVDRLITEGQSPAHFARQLVRFARNVMVAKVAGADSALLQVSGDERQRVSRIAELFNEEDLARQLQIILRTHGELGYRQEQRFHLELGLLKMAHAQKLLPLEQLLSGAGTALAKAPTAKSSTSGERVATEKTEKKKLEFGREESAAPRPNLVSPFVADSARKGGMKTQSFSETNYSRASGDLGSAPVVMGAAVAVEQNLDPEPSARIAAVKKPSAEPAAGAEDSGDALRETLLAALSSAGNRMLASMLEAGEWKLAASELTITVSVSAAVLDMSLSSDARKLLTSSAADFLGRPVRLKVVSGEVQPRASRPPSNGNGGSRIELEPVVQRMKQKFGAEIRTVIDYKTKK